MNEDGHTSYFRRWKRDYQGALCDFGETVLLRMPGKRKNKADTAWHTGIWLGKYTEADASQGSYCQKNHSLRTMEH